MKRYGIVFVVIGGLLAELAIGAGPLDIDNARPIKALNRSVDRPITLYQSIDAVNFAPPNNVFTTQTLARLGLGGIAASELSLVRNEICASSKIQAVAAAAGTSFGETPGPIGIYLANDQILAVYDNALQGERLDAVLRKLKNSPDALKKAEAAAYAKEMVRVLNAIHDGGVTWNNVNLSDFYVRPEGILTAVNFSAAKESAAANQDSLDKKNERMNLIANAIRPMYEILFPIVGQANPGAASAEFLDLAGITVGLPAKWFATDWTRANFTGIGAGAALPTYEPGVEGAQPPRAGVLRAAHAPTPNPGALVGAANMGAATGFVLDYKIVPFVPSPSGVPPTTNLVTMCANWTGNE